MENLDVFGCREKEADREPRVSICLLTWNRSSVLRRSVLSLLAQSFVDFELIINDDNSTDDTQQVCKELTSIDCRIKYCRNEKNLKYPGNSNAAIDRSRGEYILFAHDGDLYHEDLIKKWVALLDRHASAAIAFSGWRMMKDDGGDGALVLKDYPELVNGRNLLIHMLHSLSSPIFGIAMVRKSCIKSIGYFDEKFPRLTDVDFWMRLLAKYDAAYAKSDLFYVMPREDGHENNGVNWYIAQQLEDIRYTNIGRFLSRDWCASRNALAKLFFHHYWVFFTNMLWCFKHRRWDLLMKSVGFLFRYPVNVDRIR